jgi:hypothetical protein
MLFTITQLGVPPDRLPVANTCFNRFGMPQYLSKEQLKEKLLFAMSAANDGFMIE